MHANEEVRDGRTNEPLMDEPTTETLRPLLLGIDIWLVHEGDLESTAVCQPIITYVVGLN
jgi:hypothetical protein